MVRKVIVEYLKEKHGFGPYVYGNDTAQYLYRGDQQICVQEDVVVLRLCSGGRHLVCIHCSDPDLFVKIDEVVCD